MRIKLRAFNSNYYPTDRGANFIINIVNAGYTHGKNPLPKKPSGANYSALGIYQLEYAIEGICYIESDGKTHKISSGDLFFINKSTPYTLYSDTENPVKKFFVCFKGPLADALVQAYKLTEGMIILKFNAKEHFLRIMGILGAAETYDIDVEGEIVAELTKLLHAVYKEKESRKAEQIEHSCSADDILKYIDMNLGRKFSLEEMCSHFYISRTKLWRIFKEKYERTPLEYLHERRIEKAKYYLLHTDCPISSIPETVGLSDSKYFFQLFKKETGMTPRKFRETFFGNFNMTAHALQKSQKEFERRKTGNVLEEKN